QHPHYIFRRFSRRHLLLKIGKGLHVEERHHVREEERVEPHRLIHAERLQRRLVEDRDRAHHHHAGSRGGSPEHWPLKARSARFALRVGRSEGHGHLETGGSPETIRAESYYSAEGVADQAHEALLDPIVAASRASQTGTYTFVCRSIRIGIGAWLATGQSPGRDARMG